MLRFEIHINSVHQDWDNFVNNNKNGKFSHMSAYFKTIFDTYKLNYVFLVYFKNNEIIGGLPCVIIKNFLLQKKLVSCPFCDVGGFLLSDQEKLPEDFIKNSLDELLIKTKSRCIELRGRLGIPENTNNLFIEVKDCEYAHLSLDLTPMEILKNCEHSVRKNLNKAEAAKLVSINLDENEIRDHFYPLYLIKMKEFGTPPHGVEFYLNIKKNFQNNFKAYAANHNGSLTSILLGIGNEKSISLLTIVSTDMAREVCSDDFVHWKLINKCIEEKIKIFDFGVARYLGQIRFKKKWASTFIEYNHYFYPSRKGVKILNKTNKLNSFWSKYVPLFMTKILGPFFRKKLGR